MRLLDIIQTANSNIARAKLRSALTIIAVFVGAFTISLTTALGNGVSAYIDEQLGNVGGENLLYIQAKQQGQNPFASSDEPQKYQPNQRSRGQFGINQLSSQDIEAVKNFDKIQSVTPQYSANFEYITREGHKKYTVMVTQYAGLDASLAAGKLIEETDKNAILLQKKYLNVFGFDSPKDAIDKKVTIAYQTARGEIATKKLDIVGVLQKSLLGSTSLISASAAKDVVAAQSLKRLGEAGYFSAYAKVKPSLSAVEMDELQRSLAEKGINAMTMQEQLGAVNSVITGITAALTGFGAIALLAASFGIVNTLLMAVNERTREIGLMKALGMNRRGVFAIFSFEAISLGFWGALLGVLAAFGAAQVINGVAANTFLEGLPGLTLLAFSLPSVVAVTILIMLIAFIAGALPSLKASKLDPIEALRHE